MFSMKWPKPWVRVGRTYFLEIVEFVGKNRLSRRGWRQKHLNIRQFGHFKVERLAQMNGRQSIGRQCQNMDEMSRVSSQSTWNSRSSVTWQDWGSPNMRSIDVDSFSDWESPILKGFRKRKEMNKTEISHKIQWNSRNGTGRVIDSNWVFMDIGIFKYFLTEWEKIIFLDGSASVFLSTN